MVGVAEDPHVAERDPCVWELAGGILEVEERLEGVLYRDHVVGRNKDGLAWSEVVTGKSQGWLTGTMMERSPGQTRRSRLAPSTNTEEPSSAKSMIHSK